ncbi:MAG: hypothetical protein ABI172_03285 [Ginsengibacter sp.]
MPADNRSLEEIKASFDFVDYRKMGPLPISYPAQDIEQTNSLLFINVK